MNTPSIKNAMRLHPAWLWIVAPLLAAGAGVALAQINHHAGEPTGTLWLVIWSAGILGSLIIAGATALPGVGDKNAGERALPDAAELVKYLSYSWNPALSPLTEEDWKRLAEKFSHAGAPADAATVAPDKRGRTWRANVLYYLLVASVAIMIGATTYFVAVHNGPVADAPRVTMEHSG